jgi:hypothetical protein
MYFYPRDGNVMAQKRPRGRSPDPAQRIASCAEADEGILGVVAVEKRGIMVPFLGLAVPAGVWY